jgi:hypothetical protein
LAKEDNVARKFVLFAALFSVALVTGAAFAIWFDYNPTGMSPAFYTEKMQHAIRVFTIPLPTVVMLGLFFTIVSTFLARRDRPDFYLLIVASICIIAAALITAFGNIPINNQIMTWSINSPPSNWGGTSSEMVVVPYCANDLGNSWIEFLDPGITGSIRVYDSAGKVIEMHEQTPEFKES